MSAEIVQFVPKANQNRVAPLRNAQDALENQKRLDASRLEHGHEMKYPCRPKGGPLARSEDHLDLENERYRLNMASNADMAPADNAHRFVQPSIMENWGPFVVSDTAPSEYCAPDGDCA